MNTRLQVEHPVTEAITGLDLVALQIRVAAGQPLPFTQAELEIDGHAFEARLYAEDVAKGFLPATGTLTRLAFPEHATAFANAPVRIDAGVREGDSITPYYDPMIAKVITHGATRADALNALSAALGQCHIAGSITNRDFLRALTHDDDFAAGTVDTGLIERKLATLGETAEPSSRELAVAAVLLSGVVTPTRGDVHDPWSTRMGWRAWGEALAFAEFNHGDCSIAARITPTSDGFRVVMDDTCETLQIIPEPGNRLTVASGKYSRPMSFALEGGTLVLFADGQAFNFTLTSPLEDDDHGGASSDRITAPMPGLVKIVAIASGTEVVRGQRLLVLEAMKMEHTLTAPVDATVGEVLVGEGEQVTEGALLIALAPKETNG